MFDSRLLVLLVLAFTSAAIAQPIHFQVTDLGTFGGDSSHAWDINNDGLVTGWATQAAVSTRVTNYVWGSGTVSYQDVDQSVTNAFLYQNGQMVNIGRANEYSFGTGVNNAGRVVGKIGSLGDPNGRAFRLGYGPLDETVEPGTFFHPTIQGSSAAAINDNNVIIGNYYSTSGYRAYVYRDNRMQDLGLLLGAPSHVHAINNNNLVVGTSYLNANRSGPRHGYVHNLNTGITTDLGVLQKTELYWNEVAPFDINNSNQIVGSASLDRKTPFDPYTHAFLWENGQIKDLGALTANESSEAKGINDAGIIVGMSGNKCFIYVGDTMYDLSTMVDLPTGWRLSSVADINNSNQIAADIWLEASGGIVKHAALLTPTAELQAMLFSMSFANSDIGQWSGKFSPQVNPLPVLEAVPEPGSLSVVGLAAMGLLSRRRRRA